jgi:hypothetical protein
LAIQGTVVEDTTVVPTFSSFSPAFGVPGSSVTISGSNLSEVTGVKFGSQTATFNYQSSDGTIVATVPAGFRSEKIALVYGTPAAEVLSAANFDLLDGSGTASVANATESSPYLNSAIFARAQSGNQTVAVTISNAIAGSSLTSARITLPADLSAPDEANVTLSGTGTKSVSGNAILITGADIQGGSTLTVSISGLSTPNTATSVTQDGNYVIQVETAGAGGTLGTILASPSAYVLIPIANLRDVDSNGAPLDNGKTVAVEGVVTATPLGSTNAKLSAFIQDSSAGIYLYSVSAQLTTQTWAVGEVRAVMGTMNSFNGLSQIDPVRDGNIVSNGTGTLPEPVTVTLPLTNAEALEGSLIRIAGLTKAAAEADAWAVPSTITAQDGSANTIDIRMAAGSTASIEPTYPVTVVGVLGQFDNTAPRDSGYQIQPRTQGDLTNDLPSAPSNLSYTPATISGTVGTAISSLTPTVTGTVDTYSVDPALPGGLSIDAGTGVISGTPTAVATSASYTVTASNAGGSTTAQVTIAVGKGTPTISVAPTASAITAGQALSSSELSGGTASVPGTFGWTDGTAVPSATGDYEVTFTPTDTANYNTATTTVSVTVNAATPSGSSFSGWLGTNNPSAALLMQYAYGAASASNTANRSNLPSSVLSNNSLVMTYYVRKEATNPNLVTPQVHTNLSDASGWGALASSNIATVATNTVDGVEVIQKKATVPVEGTRKFLRLKIAE